jgi:uracil-DNA glycosylase family 4
MSLWTEHKSKWRDCRLCSLCETRQNVVLARGKIPADVLFIGEAPGDSEDVHGQPFVGPAGHLLNSIISRSIPERIRVCFTNLVACIPLGDEGNKTQEPSAESILACRGRLTEFIGIVQPKLVVQVGKLATKYDPSTGWRIAIVHPAAIIRSELSQRGLMIQRCEIAIRDAVQEMIDDNGL